MKTFAKNFMAFFRTSSHSKLEIAAILLGVVVLGGLSIIGGIYLFTTNPKDFGTLSFAAVGIILLSAGIYGINPESCKRFWVETLGPEDPRFDD